VRVQRPSVHGIAPALPRPLLGIALGALIIGGLNLSADSRWMTLFGGLAAAGVLAVLGADMLSRPVLARATADPSERA
jgi:hypothetical protein